MARDPKDANESGTTKVVALLKDGSASGASPTLLSTEDLTRLAHTVVRVEWDRSRPVTPDPEKPAARVAALSSLTSGEHRPGQSPLNLKKRDESVEDEQKLPDNVQPLGRAKSSPPRKE